MHRACSGWRAIGVGRLILPAGLLIILNLSVIPPNDFWWHLRVGQIIAGEHAIPRTDTFSFTRYGAPWTNQAWLMQLWLYLLQRAGGLPLVIFAHALTVTAGYVLVLKAAWRESGVRASAIALLLAMLIGAANWVVRPQAFSFLAFGALVYLIERHRAGDEGWLWLAVPLFALWSNCHGGFSFGILLLGLYTMGRMLKSMRLCGVTAAVRRLSAPLAVLALSIVALGLNPSGPAGTLRYLAGFTGHKVTMTMNAEFAPLTAMRADGVALLMSLFVLVVVMTRRRFELSLDRVLVVLAFTALSLRSVRALPWYGMAVVPPLAAAIRSVWQPRSVSAGRQGFNGVFLVVILLATLGSLPWLRRHLPLPPVRTQFVASDTPVQAVTHLCTEASEVRVFEDQAFASYQIWACPRLPVFVDTRVELYPEQLWQDYLRVSGGTFDWDEVLASYRVTHLLLSTERQALLVAAASASSNWQETYRDPQSVVFARLP